MEMRRHILAVLPLALIAVACGTDPGAIDRTTTTGENLTTTNPEGTTSTVGSGAEQGLLRCAEVPLVSADPSFYRDDPKYIGNEMPVEDVRRWASQYPDYVDLWIDREHNGWVTVAFTGNVAERQAEIDTEFPDDGVVAVGIDWTEDDLLDLQTRVHEELEGVVDVQGSWTDMIRGRVGIQVPVLSEENLDAIAERFPDARLCVEGLEPEAVVPPGPQPTEGDGWRLILDEKGVGLSFMTGIAWDSESLNTLLQDIEGLPDVDVDVDFENEVAIWFGAVYSGSCPNIRLDNVVVDEDTIYPEIVNTDNALACTDDANPHTYLVALERERLPETPFYIQIFPDLGPDRLLVEADLGQPGSVARPDQVGLDTSSLESRPDRSPTVIEPEFPWVFAIDLTCGFEYLGEINSYDWVASEPIPETWLTEAKGQSEITVEVILNQGDPEPFVEVNFLDETVTYLIGDPDC